MPRASNAKIGKKAILNVLQKAAILGKEYRHKDLHKKVKDVVSSPTSFHKYMNQLLDDGLVFQRRDPDDGREVLISINPDGEAKLESIFLSALDKIDRLTMTQTLNEYLTVARKHLEETEQPDEADAELSKQPYVKHQARLGKLVEMAHSAFAEACESGEDDHLRVHYDSFAAKMLGKEKPVLSIEVLPHNLFKTYEDGWFMLQQVKKAAGKNPTLMRLIDEAIPDFLVPLSKMRPRAKLVPIEESQLYKATHSRS